ncbi:hypothetical protein [Spirosoma pollinicola]|nr:hypothetical protein [Spirosoma pollinicola]
MKLIYAVREVQRSVYNEKKIMYTQYMNAETVKKTSQKALNRLDDPRLDDIFKSGVIFPEKLAQANEFLAKHPLPKHLRRRKA